MAKGEVWFWLLKLSGILQMGGLIALFFVTAIMHMDWSSGGGPCAIFPPSDSFSPHAGTRTR